MSKTRYKVHSAICSWNIPGALTTITKNVTDKAQQLLNDSRSQGILMLDKDFLNEESTESSKSFAMIVSITLPNGDNITRMCTSPEGPLLHVKNAGIICDF
jgi:hypothetical protein